MCSLHYLPLLMRAAGRQISDTSMADIERASPRSISPMWFVGLSAVEDWISNIAEHADEAVPGTHQGAWPKHADRFGTRGPGLTRPVAAEVMHGRENAPLIGTRTEVDRQAQHTTDRSDNVKMLGSAGPAIVQPSRTREGQRTKQNLMRSFEGYTLLTGGGYRRGQGSA